MGQGNVFPPVCNSVQGGVPGQLLLPGRYISPFGRYPPGQVHPPTQVHPLGRYTQLGSYLSQADTSPGRYIPPRQVHPQAGTPPDSACWDTVNKWAVRILLECILVIAIFSGHSENIIGGPNPTYQNTTNRFQMILLQIPPEL